MRFHSLKVLGLTAWLATPAMATTFEFVSAENEVVPVLWAYREVATRTFLGCRQWDVLQGTGWFQATWHTEYTPVLEDHDTYTVTPRQNLAAKICAAKMDAYNSVRVEAGDLRGFFPINPDGQSSETEVTCRPNPEGSEYDSLVCDEAHVAVSEKGTVRIYIRFEE